MRSGRAAGTGQPPSWEKYRLGANRATAADSQHTLKLLGSFKQKPASLQVLFNALDAQHVSP